MTFMMTVDNVMCFQSVDWSRGKNTDSFLAVTGRTIDVRLDLEFLRPLRSVGFRVLDFQIQLRNQIGVANVLRRIPMAIQAPFHRHRLDLSDDFHLVNPTMARHTTDPFVDVNTVVEVDEIRQIVNPLPQHWITRLKARTHWRQQFTFGFDNPQITPRHPRRFGGGPVSTVTITAGRGRWNRRVARSLDRVVAITAVQFQLAGVDLVTERHWLLGLMPDIDDRGVDRGEQTGREITAHGQSDQNDQDRKLVNPSWKMKLLHSILPDLKPVRRTAETP